MAPSFSFLARAFIYYLFLRLDLFIYLLFPLVASCIFIVPSISFFFLVRFSLTVPSWSFLLSPPRSPCHSFCIIYLSLPSSLSHLSLLFIPKILPYSLSSSPSLPPCLLPLILVRPFLCDVGLSFPHHLTSFSFLFLASLTSKPNITHRLLCVSVCLSLLIPSRISLMFISPHHPPCVYIEEPPLSLMSLQLQAFSSTQHLPNYSTSLT